jgi:multiple sugar transport system permease protein
MSNPTRPTFDRNWPTAAAFLAPNFVGFLSFTLFPVVLSLLMAFHHWTLRPHEAVRFVGLRNFVDLVGVRAVEQGDPGLLSLYVLCAVGLIGSLIGLLLANVNHWRGTRASGVLVSLMGLVIVGSSLGAGEQTSFWYVEAAQGSLLAGLLAVIVGGLIASRDSLEWEIGPGTLPGTLLVLCVFGLASLDALMWAAYEPRDGRFWYYLYNTLYLMLGLPVAIAGALSLAILLNEDLPFGTWRRRAIGASACGGLALLCVIVGFGLGWPNVGVLAGIVWLFAGLGFLFNIVTFRTIFYLPQFTSGVAVYVLWKSLYRPETGPINQGLESLFTTLGLALVPPSWLAEIAWAKPAIVAMGVWIFIGGQNMLLYLAALSNVPLELIDAANVDGASRWQRFRHVTWPQLAPTTFFISIVSVIGGLQGGFEQARVMTEGGPAGSTTSLSYYIYNKMFGDLDMGYAAAISWVLFAVIFVATALNWRFGRSQEVDY